MYRNKRKHKLKKCSQHFFEICVDSLGVCLWSEHLARGGLCNGDGTWRGGKQYVNASDINNLTLRNLFHQNGFYRDWASGTNENRFYGMFTWRRGNLYGRWCLSAPLPSTYKRYQCVYFKIQNSPWIFFSNKTERWWLYGIYFCVVIHERFIAARPRARLASRQR